MRIGDRFNPYRMFTGIFIPEAVCRSRSISGIQKLIYGRLLRYAGETGDAYPAIRSIAEEIGAGERQVSDHLSALEDTGFIEKEHREGTTTVYHFLWHGCFEGEAGEERAGPQPLRKLAEVPNSSDPCGFPQGGSADFRRGGLRISADEESQEESQLRESLPPLTPPEEGNTDQRSLSQTLPSEAAVASSDEDVLTAVRRLYRQTRGAKLDNLLARSRSDLRARLERLDEDVGREELLGALVRFLADDSDFLRSHRWPIRVFLSQRSRYVDGRPAGLMSPLSPRVPPAAEATPGPTQRPESLRERWTRLWHELVPSGPPIKRWLPAWEAALRDPDLDADGEEILSKCERVIRSGKFSFVPSFGWLIKNENWAKLLNGEYDWALGPGPVANLPAAEAEGADEQPDPKAELRKLCQRREEILARYPPGEWTRMTDEFYATKDEDLGRLLDNWEAKLGDVT